MVVPNLKGGLGNQMFQIACAYAYAKRLGTTFAINYNIPHHGGQGNPPSKYRDTLFKNIPTTDIVPYDIVVSEKGFTYNELPKTRGDILLDGYWQSEKYFADYRDEIEKLFYFSDADKEKWNKLTERLEPESIIGCHVRRGDYVHYEHTHPCLGRSYYNEAISYLERSNTIITENVVDNVVVCCDDWYALNEENIFTPTEYIKYYSTSGSNELQDLYTLSMCKRLVMSNSTFSWWAAFLGRSRGNTVVTPKRWFGKHGPQDTDDLYNTFWYKI
jgi:hypothetical protein